MKRAVRFLAWSVAGVVGFVLALAFAVRVAVSIPAVQDYLKDRAVLLLEERLGTHVEVGGIQIAFLQRRLILRDVAVDDRRGEQMFRLGVLRISMTDVDPFNKRFTVSSLRIRGVEANIYKERKDSAANYQFVVDAFRSKRKSVRTDSVRKRAAFDLEVSKVVIRDVNVRYDVRWKGQKNLISLKSMSYDCGKDSTGHLIVEELNLHTDNGKPHKRTGKPNRGYFDAGHVNLTANVDADVKILGKDSFQVCLKNACAIDSASGLRVDSLRCLVHANKRLMNISDVRIVDNDTWIDIPVATVCLPDRKDSSQLYFDVPSLCAKVVLRDISRPFAPVLGKFTTPLYLETNAHGGINDIVCDDIRIVTRDNRLRIVADGVLSNLGRKKEIDLFFRVKRLKAVNGMLMQLIRHFKTRKSMDAILRSVGNVTLLNGTVQVLYKREKFTGHLLSRIGTIDARVNLDNTKRWMSATACSHDLDLGKLIEDKKCGKLSFNASAGFDITSKRKARMLGIKFHKLPKGFVKGMVHEVSYGKLRLKRVAFSVISKGDYAEGDICMEKRYADLGCTFTFDDTDFKQYLKVKPKVKLYVIGKKRDKAEGKKVKGGKGDKRDRKDKGDKKDRKVKGDKRDRKDKGDKKDRKDKRDRKVKGDKRDRKDKGLKKDRTDRKQKKEQKD